MTISFLRRLLPVPRSRQDIERAYLDRSVSIYDLERRQREVDEGKFAGL